jgi:hypothetical protein
VVLDAPDARSLAEFYAQLLGWMIAKAEPGYAVVAAPVGAAFLAFNLRQNMCAPSGHPPTDASR